MSWFLKTKRKKTFFCTKHNIQYVLHKINLYPMFAVYMYKNIGMLKSKHYTRWIKRINQIMDTNKCMNTCLAKKTPKDYKLKPSKSLVESPSCRYRQKYQLLTWSESFPFPWSWPPFGECVCQVSLSLWVSRYELCVCVCVREHVCVCACEHKFGVTTNHGKFKVWLGTYV